MKWKAGSKEEGEVVPEESPNGAQRDEATKVQQVGNEEEVEVVPGESPAGASYSQDPFLGISKNFPATGAKIIQL